METLLNKLLAFGIVAAIFLFIYAKIRRQSFRDVIDDIKRLFSLGGGEKK